MTLATENDWVRAEAVSILALREVELLVIVVRVGLWSIDCLFFAGDVKAGNDGERF